MTCLLNSAFFIFHRHYPIKLTNTMQRKLDELRREKAMLERQIEREHAADHHPILDKKSESA